MKNQQRTLLKQLVAEAGKDPEFKAKFFSGILLPDKLNEEFMKNDKTHVEKTINNTKKAANEEEKKAEQFTRQIGRK